MSLSNPSDSLASIVDRYRMDEEGLLRGLERFSFGSYEEAVGRLWAHLKATIQALEASRHNYQAASEDALSDFIVSGLKSAGFDARRGDSAGGETDLMVKFHAVEGVWIGEAKIWRKIDDAREGILQLVTRYCSGREKQVCLLFYCKTATICDKITAWKAGILEMENVGYIHDTISDVVQWDFSFSSKHRHPDVGCEFLIQHTFVNLIHNPKDKSARARKPKEPAERRNEEDGDV